MELFYVVLLLLALGLGGGFLAGLLGVGGGAVFVPGLYYILKHYGFADNAMHIAVGTSLLVIILTGLSSARAHYKRGVVDVVLLRQFLPGVFIGVGVGTALSGVLSTQALKVIFAVSQLSFGSYMLLRVNRTALVPAMPRQPWVSVIACANACLATMMGVGGGVQNVTFMTLCNVPIHRAIATVAAIGPFIAVIGAGGFLYIGLSDPDLPRYSIGYLNFAAAGVIMMTSLFMAPVGARLAHSLPVSRLKRAFSIFMLCVSLKMLSEIFMS